MAGPYCCKREWITGDRGDLVRIVTPPAHAYGYPKDGAKARSRTLQERRGRRHGRVQVSPAGYCLLQRRGRPAHRDPAYPLAAGPLPGPARTDRARQRGNCRETLAALRAASHASVAPAHRGQPNHRDLVAPSHHLRSRTVTPSSPSRLDRPGRDRKGPTRQQLTRHGTGHGRRVWAAGSGQRACGRV